MLTTFQRSPETLFNWRFPAPILYPFQPLVEDDPQTARNRQPRREADHCAGCRIVFSQLEFGVVRQRL
jgi:hypothetical protein